MLWLKGLHGVTKSLLQLQRCCQKVLNDTNQLMQNALPTQLALHGKEVHKLCRQASYCPVLAHIHLLQVRTLLLRTGPSRIFLLRG